MFILIKPKPISSKSRVYLVKSYRDVNGKAKHEFVKCYGSYNELIAKDPNFINNLKKETKSSSGLVKDKITIDPLKPSNWHNIYNIGYIFCKSVLFAFKPDFLKLIKDLNLNKFYRYLLYRMMYDNHAEFQHELFYEGPFNKKIVFPNYQVLQQLSLKIGNPTSVSVLVLQRISIYSGDEQNDHIFSVLIDSNGYPLYFHLINISTTKLIVSDVVRLLEAKFKTKIYVAMHQSITPHLDSRIIYRSWYDYEKGFKIASQLQSNLDFNEEQVATLRHTIVGINKFISHKSIQLTKDTSNQFIQLVGFICTFQIGIFNYFRILAFKNLKMDFLLQDIQETFAQINFNDFTKDYVHIVLNPKNIKWQQLYYLIFDEQDIRNILVSPYFKTMDLDHDVWINYISKRYKEISWKLPK